MLQKDRPGLKKIFRDRRDAGQQLGRILSDNVLTTRCIVLGLPRGGVPVAYEVAVQLGAKLDVFLVRKLGLPGQEELAMGAIASGGGFVLNEDLVRREGLSRQDIDRVLHREKEKLAYREELYRGSRAFPDIRGRSVVLVDDGLATGSSMLVAIRANKEYAPSEITVAVPVGSEDACHSLNKEADRVICLKSPKDFRAVGEWYQNFSQTTDEEVIQLLARAETGLDEAD
ncbi:MAG: phosphoribosyltransferase [Desulfohalobiaceae bacterium]|nr:phosphoribosyltransferase [Desulfohalobiaceae bacterium]